jgi:adenosylcobyric acid synthase
MTTPAIMILGTASHAGKSLVTAGLGRIFSDDGRKVAPFKAQNMSLNSAATVDGREIGRAQALQADACRVMARAEMNPVLIKPSSETGSQVMLLGRVWGQVTASDYFRGRVEELFPVVVDSYRRLASEHDLMLLEGAGSPAEINLRQYDIVNMRMAHAADAACLLVGDIDRGGVFASLVGTMELLSSDDRARIRAFVINKFRGDISLLWPGVEMIERRLGIPCAGVIPLLRGHGLEEEDSVAMENRRTPECVWQGPRGMESPLRVGVVALPHMANFTDFDVFAMEPSVSLSFVEDPIHLALCDVLIIPGSKQTLDDLVWLRRSGLARAIVDYAGVVIGICGGFQMLGDAIEDPLGVESNGEGRVAEGLALLSIRTVMQGGKTVRRVSGTVESLAASPFHGYEIHMGETIYCSGCKPLADILREGDSTVVRDGAVSVSGRVWGTYVHGIFDDDAFRHSFIDAARKSSGLTPAPELCHVTSQREARIDRWADHLRASLKMDLIRGWIGNRG